MDIYPLTVGTYQRSSNLFFLRIDNTDCFHMVRDYFVATVFVLMLLGSDKSFGEFDWGEYETARRKPIFGRAFSFVSERVITKSDGRNSVGKLEYFQKGDLRKSVYALESSTNKEDRPGVATTVILNDWGCVYFISFPSDSSYYTDSVIMDKSDSENAFKSVLPISAAYEAFGFDLLKLRADKSFHISNVVNIKENNRHLQKINFTYSLVEDSITYLQDVEFTLDTQNNYAITKVSMRLSPKDSSITLREQLMEIAYIDAYGRRLPQNITVRTTSNDGDSWTEIQFSEIEFSFSPIDDKLFDLSEYDFKKHDGSLNRRYLIFIGVFVSLFVTISVVRRLIYHRTLF